MNSMIKKIKEYIRRRNLLFRMLEPVYYLGASLKENIVLFFHERGIFKYYICYPIGSLIRVLRAKIQPRYLKEIKDIKNQYNGRRCFIIAGGSSLKIEDLEILYKHDEISFGVNTIYKLYNLTKWKPQFYCCLDLQLEKEIENSMGKEAFGMMAQEKVFLDYSVNTIPKLDNIVSVYYNRLLHGFGKRDDDFKYSDDMIFGLYDMYDVTITTIQIAKYMGFDEVYLLGVDCNYLEKKRYVDGAESENSKDLSIDYYRYIQKQKIKAYKYFANKLGADKNFKVYNATRGGNLDVFPRVELESIL